MIARNRNVPAILVGLVYIAAVWALFIAAVGYGTRWAVPVSGVFALATAYAFQRLRQTQPKEHLLRGALATGRDTYFLVTAMSAVFSVIEMIASGQASLAAKGGTLDTFVQAIDRLAVLLTPERLLPIRLALLGLASLIVIGLLADWRLLLLSTTHRWLSFGLRWLVISASALGTFALQGMLTDGNRLTTAAGFRVQMDAVTARYEKSRQKVRETLVSALVDRLVQNAAGPPPPTSDAPRDAHPIVDPHKPTIAGLLPPPPPPPPRGGDGGGPGGPPGNPPASDGAVARELRAQVATQSADALKRRLVRPLRRCAPLRAGPLSHPVLK